MFAGSRGQLVVLWMASYLFCTPALHKKIADIPHLAMEPAELVHVGLHLTQQAKLAGNNELIGYFNDWKLVDCMGL